MCVYVCVQCSFMLISVVMCWGLVCPGYVHVCRRLQLACLPDRLTYFTFALVECETIFPTLSGMFKHAIKSVHPHKLRLSTRKYLLCAGKFLIQLKKLIEGRLAASELSYLTWQQTWQGKFWLLLEDTFLSYFGIPRNCIQCNFLFTMNLL